MTYQLEKINRTSMEHVSLSDITIGYKELAISRACLDNTLMHTNQASVSIDIWRHGDRGIFFGSQKSCNKIIIDLGPNTNDGIRVNPSRTIGSISHRLPV